MNHRGHGGTVKKGIEPAEAVEDGEGTVEESPRPRRRGPSPQWGTPPVGAWTPTARVIPHGARAAACRHELGMWLREVGTMARRPAWLVWSLVWLVPGPPVRVWMWLGWWPVWQRRTLG